MDQSEDWQFIIPLSKEDLLKSSSGQYSVEKIIGLKTCLNSLKDMKKEISAKGCICILQIFDILYSILSEKEIDFSRLQDVYDGVISRMLKDTDTFVREALNADDPASKREAVNIIKMNIYIFSLFEKTYEDKLSFNSENFISDSKRNKGVKWKSKGIKPEDIWDWNFHKKMAFTNIYSILQQKLNTLWPSYIVEEPLINLIGNCCYKAFENPEIAQVKLKPLRDSVSHVLSVLVASHNHGITFIPKIIQLMKQFEHAATVISSCTILMATEYKCSTVIPKMLKELNKAIQDEDVPGLAKSVAAFITDIAETDPVLLLPSVKTLSINLTVEPYVVRNASLIAFTEIILKCLSDGDIDKECQIRDQLLEHLHNHLRDQNSYVRSKVLQLWCKLAAERAIPKDFVMTLLQSAKNRISDKSFMAVKSAIQLCTSILKENPYAGKLNIADMRGQLLQAKTTLRNINAKRTLSRDEAWTDLEVDLILAINKYISNLESNKEEETVSTQTIKIADVLLIIIKLLQEKHFVEAINLLKHSEVQFPNAQEIRCNLDKDSDPVEYYTTVLKKIFTKTPDILDNIPLEFDTFKEEYIKQKATVDYIEKCISFTLLMNGVGKDINTILKSKSIMGVSEAIDFFTTAYQFGVADSKRVMRSILLLVRCDQQPIKDAVAAAYKKLYLTTCQKTARARALHIAQRLTKLLEELDMEQKDALEVLIDLWVDNNELDREFIQVLWEKFDKKEDQVTEKESISALILLDMIALKKPSLVSSNLETIINAALDKPRDLMAVQYSCKILTKISMIKKHGKCKRLPQEHELFEKIVNLLVTNFNKIEIQGYIPMSLAAITMISKICCYPEKILDILLRRLYEQIFDDNGNRTGDGDIVGSTTQSVKELLVERLLVIHGEIVLRKWHYFTNDVVNFLAKNLANTELKEKENVDEMDEFEAETRDAENDALLNSLNELCEELITDESTIDAHIRDMAIKVCTNQNVQCSRTLKAAAATTLAKYMMVSQAFCENKIQLFVTLMEKSKEETVRGNLVLAFGDLLIRYPNVIEPWSRHLFTRLTDTNVIVRKNTVLVICHLVTREMVKVRGHVAEVCLCLEDSEITISEQVHSLFVDLARKGNNTLYNIIPDIISRLSNPERSEAITSDVFDRIMRFILGLIGKERQNELLVEKLCTRLCESSDQRQWRDLTFCLKQLHYNEKCLRKLIDALPHMNERLLCSEVHSNLVAIFNNAQKSTKQNFTEIANEGLAKIEELLTCKDKHINKERNTVSEQIMNPTTPLRIPMKTKVRSSRKPKKPRF